METRFNFKTNERFDIKAFYNSLKSESDKLYSVNIDNIKSDSSKSYVTRYIFNYDMDSLSCSKNRYLSFEQILDNWKKYFEDRNQLIISLTKNLIRVENTELNFDS
jgi:hypothetical protein